MTIRVSTETPDSYLDGYAFVNSSFFDVSEDDNFEAAIEMKKEALEKTIGSLILNSFQNVHHLYVDLEINEINEPTGMLYFNSRFKPYDEQAQDFQSFKNKLNNIGGSEWISDSIEVDITLIENNSMQIPPTPIYLRNIISE